MPKRLKLAAGVLVLLLFAAAATWSWYFATRPAPQFVAPPSVPPPVLQMRAATAKERANAIKSIVSQLEAFKADRYEIATQYQSKALKNNFASVANFRKVIKEAYPQFAHYRSAKFGASRATTNGKQIHIAIQLTGKDGVVVRAMYVMELEDGVYRVASVSGGETPPPLPHPDTSPEPDLPPGVRKIASKSTPAWRV